MQIDYSQFDSRFIRTQNLVPIPLQWDSPQLVLKVNPTALFYAICATKTRTSNCLKAKNRQSDPVPTPCFSQDLHLYLTVQGCQLLEQVPFSLLFTSEQDLSSLEDPDSVHILFIQQFCSQVQNSYDLGRYPAPQQEGKVLRKVGEFKPIGHKRKCQLRQNLVPVYALRNALYSSDQSTSYFFFCVNRTIRKY